MAKLARWLVEEGLLEPCPAAERGQGEGNPAALGKRDPPFRRGEEELADLAERAARLAKADLVTGMVGEFPELQGVIGGYLAEAQGEPEPSPTPSATITSRWGRAMTCRRRR